MRVEAVDVAIFRVSTHRVHEAAEKGALPSALARDVSLPTVAAVDGLKDGLDDVTAGTSGWGWEIKLCEVEVMKLRVVPQAGCVELMRTRTCQRT